MVSTSAAQSCLIIFTRYPEPGQVKTRLIPVLGPDGAALLHQRMAEHTLGQARDLKDAALEVWFTGGTRLQMQTWLGQDLVYQLQPKGDLGDRMTLAFASAFSKGYTAVAIIGTDCPDLSTDLLKQSFSALEHHELVLGPAVDGGYYLIGLQSLRPELLTDIAWSTNQVLGQTVETAKKLNLSPYYLTELNDIDRPEDLKRGAQHKLF